MQAGAHKIGPVLATAIVAGNMIGSGIFLLPAVLASVGSASLLGWLLAAFGAMALAAVYAMLAVHRPDTEGLIDYPAKALHPALGFMNWLAYWTACWVGNIAVFLAAVGYFLALVSFDADRQAETALLIAAIWIAAFLNLFGAKSVGRFATLSLIVGLAPIAAAIAIGLIKFDPGLFAASWNVSGEPLWRATPPIVLTIFWAFLGLESANALVGVVREPKKTIPRAAIFGTGLAGLVYAAASAALFGLAPASVLAASSAPFADVIGLVMGGVAGGVIAATAFVKTFGCVVGWLLVSAQASQAGAAAGYIPALPKAKDGAANERRHVLIIAVLMSLVALATISPTLNQQFLLIVDFSVFLFLFVYGLSSLSLVVFARAFDTPAERRRGVMLGGLGAFVSVAVTAGYFVV